MICTFIERMNNQKWIFMINIQFSLWTRCFQKSYLYKWDKVQLDNFNKVVGVNVRGFLNFLLIQKGRYSVGNTCLLQIDSTIWYINLTTLLKRKIMHAANKD